MGEVLDGVTYFLSANLLTVLMCATQETDSPTSICSLVPALIEIQSTATASPTKGRKQPSSSISRRGLHHAPRRLAKFPQ